MGLHVKLGFAVQQAFLLNAPEGPWSYNCASALLGPACHRDANPAFVVSSGALCHCGSRSKGHATRETLSPSALAGPGTPTLASAAAGTFIGRGGKSSPTGNATPSPALDRSPTQCRWRVSAEAWKSCSETSAYLQKAGSVRRPRAQEEEMSVQRMASRTAVSWGQ